MEMGFPDHLWRFRLFQCACAKNGSEYKLIQPFESGAGNSSKSLLIVRHLFQSPSSGIRLRTTVGDSIRPLNPPHTAETEGYC